ncbi:NADPH-dependent ferric siderophore reductase [Aureimonas endophytica]|uniref:NADPH-dependent ferric siderophore reductase n=1 Tax=Aureimonas endophytica TaxID=2027858 RepID=A0A917EA58_9HYPH|nr:siderophore-interacting protein [Aureimonas endophytica]GGE14112.1 NADPH-dependent ferric siderophore reductase [Aureimonas endophytica]
MVSAAMAGAPRLKAEALLAYAEAPALMDRLCDHFVEHASVSRDGASAHLSTDYGEAAMRAAPDRLHVTVEAGDETSLAYMKMAVAEHVIEFARPAPSIAWTGDGCEARVPPFFREMRVAAARQVTPHMRRVTLVGSDLDRFAHGGLHLRLLLPPKDRPAPKWPELGPDGRLAMPEGEDALASRVYTIRRIDVAAGEIDVDMVLHEGEGMPGSDFAASARPGDVVGITGPGGGDIPTARRLVLLGDETALPAIARILAEIGPDREARAFIEIAGASERQALPSPASVAVEWLARGGAAPGTTDLLLDAARAAVGPGDGEVFVWAAAEFAAFRAIRAYLRKELGRSRQDHLVMSYWRRGVCGDGSRDTRER